MWNKYRGSQPLVCPSGLLGMLVLVVLTEVILAGHRTHFDSLDLASYRFPAESVRAASKCAIMAFGDSLVKHGVLPRVLEERLGRPTFNLAVSGGMPAASYILLQRALESGARPDAVLVDFSSSNILVDPGCAAVPMSALPNLGECLELGLSYRDANFLTTLLLARTFTSFQIRDNLRSVTRRWLDPSRPLSFFPAGPYWRNWEQNRGAQLNEKNAQSVAPDGPKNLGKNLLPHWRCNWKNERYIIKFLTLAESHRVPVFWLIPPTHPKLQSWRDERGADGDYERFVGALQQRFPNLQVIDARRSGYGPDWFWDAVHLDRDGAVVFSTQVADALRARGNGGLAEPRWVLLPRPHAEEPRRELEDVAQSGLALRPLPERR